MKFPDQKKKKVIYSSVSAHFSKLKKKKRLLWNNSTHNHKMTLKGEKDKTDWLGISGLVECYTLCYTEC